MKKNNNNIQNKVMSTDTSIMTGIRFGRPLLILFLLTVIFTFNTSAQNCSLKLRASNNIESVNAEGRIYFMELDNNSAQNLDVNLSYLNVYSGSNPDESSSAGNVKLNAEFLDSDGNAVSNVINVASNHSLKFLVKVTVPNNTPIERWNSIQINVTSASCTAYAETLILYTFIPGSGE